MILCIENSKDSNRKLLNVFGKIAGHKLYIQKMGLEVAYLNVIKAMYEKPTANIILNGQKLKAFPL